MTKVDKCVRFKRIVTLGCPNQPGLNQNRPDRVNSVRYGSAPNRFQSDTGVNI